MSGEETLEEILGGVETMTDRLQGVEDRLGVVAHQ